MRSSAWDNIAIWLSPLSISLPTFFLVSFGSTLINHLPTNPHLRVCTWGTQDIHQRSLEVDFSVWNERACSIVTVVTAEGEEGGIMAKLP